MPTYLNPDSGQGDLLEQLANMKLPLGISR